MRNERACRSCLGWHEIEDGEVMHGDLPLVAGEVFPSYFWRCPRCGVANRIGDSELPDRVQRDAIRRRTMLPPAQPLDECRLRAIAAARSLRADLDGLAVRLLTGDALRFNEIQEHAHALLAQCREVERR